MLRSDRLAWAALAVLLASNLVFGQEVGNFEKRSDYDSYKVLNRIRNGHACIMSIVFIVLFPLGAISIHLPTDRIPGLRNTYLRNRVPAIHAPIQMIGFVMMIGGMGLGIRLAHDTGYLTAKPAEKHIVIGLLVTCTLILFQPIMGYLQHSHYKRTGGKGIYAYIHRWIGRTMIILGIINNGFGFQLASEDINIPKSSIIRNSVLAGCLVLIWIIAAVVGHFQQRRAPVVTEKGRGGVDDHVVA